MGMYDEMKKRKEEVREGTISFEFEASDEHIKIKGKIDATRGMIIEAFLALIETMAELEISQNEIMLARLNNILNDKAKK